MAAHRSVMSHMLGMVKNEMVLVNKVDADRDRLDDYLAELEQIQSTQLDHISKLRDVSFVDRHFSTASHAFVTQSYQIGRAHV